MTSDSQLASSPPGKGGETDMIFNKLSARVVLRLLARESGQTMAEYGVVLAVITIGAIAAFTALAGGVNKAISDVTALLP